MYLSLYLSIYVCMHVCMYVYMHASCIYDDRLFGGAHELAMGGWEMAARAASWSMMRYMKEGGKAWWSWWGMMKHGALRWNDEVWWGLTFWLGSAGGNGWIGGLQAFLLGCKAGGPFLHELPQKRTSCGAFVARAEAMVQAVEMPRRCHHCHLAFARSRRGWCFLLHSPEAQSEAPAGSARAAAGRNWWTPKSVAMWPLPWQQSGSDNAVAWGELCL